MTPRAVPLLLVTALVVGCGEAGPQPDDDAVPNIEATPSEDAPPAHATDSVAWDSDDCGFHRTQAHPDPVRLVRDYATRDSAASFLRHDPWLETALVCPDAVFGFDLATVIEGFEVGEALGAGDRVRVPVAYQRLGELMQDEFEADRGVVTDTFELVRTPFGWRIVEPVPWRISAGHVTEEMPLSEESRRTLTELRP